MKKTSLKIKGMHCATCAMNIESALKEAKGISSAQVNFSMEKAAIEYDPKKIKESEIKRIVKETGYEVLEKEGEAEEEIKKEWRRFWFGLLLTVPVFFDCHFLLQSSIELFTFCPGDSGSNSSRLAFLPRCLFQLKTKNGGYGCFGFFKQPERLHLFSCRHFFHQGPGFL